MNRPVASASCRNFCATSFSGSNGPVVLITNWIGRPVEPGSGGGWKATTCAPAMPASSPCTIGCSWLEVIVRLSHGFRT